MLIGVGVSCRILHSIVSYLYATVADRLARLGKTELVQSFLLSFICYYVVSVRRGFFFLLMLEIGYITFFIVALPVPSI